MNSRRALVTGLAVVAVGVGLSLVVGLVPASGLETNAGTVWVLGLLALVLGINAVRGRLAADALPPITPEPERHYRVPAPGDGFDRRLAGLSIGGSRPNDADWAAVRNRLEETALSVLTRHGEHTPTEARDHLDRGTWTDDPHAAAFFASDIVPATGAWRRFRDALHSRPVTMYQVRHAVAALSRTMDGEGEHERNERTTNEPSASRSRPPFADSARTGDDGSHWPWPGETFDRRTERWRGASAFALLAAGLGMITRQPALLLLSVVGVVFVAYVHTVRPPTIDLELDRTVSDESPAPGEEVDVTVTVRNAGERTLFDLGIVDGVPPGAVVTEGSPRLATALRPGKTATFSYTITATQGDHRFEPALVVGRDPSGASERATRVVRKTTIRCIQPLDTVTQVRLRAQTTRHTGRVPSDTGGSGVEFHATREYHHGDPLSRIDWNRLAKTGTLATTEFRVERAATVMLVIDARREAYLAPDDGPSAVTRSVEAAKRVFASLVEEGERVGITALAPDPCWVAPGTGTAHRVRVREMLSSDPALSPRPPDEPSPAPIRPHRSFPDDAQVLVFSPLCDDGIVEFVRRCDATGHRSTVISPDSTDKGTPGRQLAHTERSLRSASLRQVGIPVFDWGRDESLVGALSDVDRRWSA